MRVLGVIPARLGSTRLPNKPLQTLAGEPLITRVIERVLDHGLLGQLVVATDSEKVARVAERSGVSAVLTSSSHATGTDRVAEVANRVEFSEFDTIVNIQGDEPFLTREALVGALGRVEHGDEIGTAAAPLDPARASEPGLVKVVTDADGRALYFSRAAIPHRRDSDESSGEGLYWQHIGIYACTRSALARWVGLPPNPLEQAERLEQLRALYQGIRIGVAHLDEAVLPGIDTAEDLRRAEAHWHAYQGQV
jgi:3-deoxy-manno-octulosonate cytidylyltransferase (CMP-KDO synthetase)